MARATICDELNINSRSDVDKYIAGLYARFTFPTPEPATIENLPTSSLIQICSYLQPNELVNLAVSSEFGISLQLKHYTRRLLSLTI